MYNNRIKRRCLCDTSLEEQDNFWQDLTNTKEGRVKLLKIGITTKEIEKLYLDCNNIKIDNKTILNESWQLKI